MVSINQNIQLHDEWHNALGSEFDQPYMLALYEYLHERKRSKAVIYPQSSHWFNALNSTPLSQVRVVLLGQDPYHGAGQAHGLSFSVPKGVRTPPSLKNIYKELAADLEVVLPTEGNLSHWAKQGVLLLNSVLTVEEGLAGAHQGRGWERFTDAVITAANEQCNHVIFLLWGAYAQRKAACVDERKHLVLRAPHPSPLSAHRGFFGTKPFSKTNDYLHYNGHKIIDWQ